MKQMESQANQPSRALAALRWIATPIAAVLGSVFVYWLVVKANQISMPFAGIDPNSLLAEIFTLASSNIIFGGAFVYIAIYVAPSHEKKVAIVFAGLLILLAGVALFQSILANDWKVILQLMLAALAAATLAYDRAINDIPLDEMW